MGSYSGSCEIVEAVEELDSVRHSKGYYSSSHSGSVVVGGSDRKPPMSKQGYKEYLEDDINQLFEALSFKKSSKGLGPFNQSDKGISPSRKDLMKRPIAVSAPHSPRAGSSEPVTLKQALREHCLSKASEMAAMKRLSRSSTTLGISEAERIKGLYSSVVLDTGTSGHYPCESSRNMFEISPVPVKNESISAYKMHQHLQIPKMKSSDKSAQSSPRFQAFKSPIQSAGSSPRFAVPKVKGSAETSLMQNDGPSRSINFWIPKLPIDTGTKSIRSSVMGAIGNKGLKSPTQSVNSSSGSGVPNKENINETEPMQSGTALPSKAETQAVKKSMAQQEKHSLATSLSYSDHVDNVKSSDRKVTTTSTKVGIRLSPSKTVRRGRFQTKHSVLSGVRVSKFRRALPNFPKSSIQTKTMVKRKPKQGVIRFTASVPIVVSNSSVPSTKQLICHKCHCTLKNVIEQPDEDSPVSSPSAVVSSGIMYIGAKPNFAISDQNANGAVGEAERNSKLREKGEFSQSSKSSLCEFSTSTSNSDESNASRTSWSNKPHMSKDLRWQAIRHIKVRDGGLSLDHFSLLKKLGSGDIGTVYLAELIGSNCLFALKVMDIEFLATRKKMPRAQAEREILRMLDHPFLPTLYAQFISDNLSCLVMEYCPGGDLHVLRQKQPARSFPEPAARFYVAEVLLALEYLHMLGIIYRDLKPENILVREDGHIMLTDFDLSLRCSVNPTLLQSSPQSVDPARISGQCVRSSCMQPFCIGSSGKDMCFSRRALPPTTAKARKMKTELAAQIRSMPQLVAEPTDARSNSFVGTHEYLAPEIIKGDGHGAAVDWWTFGIFLYELLYGKTPFKGYENDETLANVVLQSLKFPDTPLVTLQARDLIRRLLVKEPENRLGTEKGAAEIKQHPFFEGLNWALIRCAIPPEIPEFYDIGVLNQMDSRGTDSSSYMEYKATSDHIEFELF